MPRRHNLIRVFLQPGDMFVGDNNYQISTTLGSCVSITLWHSLRQIGGMSHFLLPTREGMATAPAPDGRYGDEALQMMFKALEAAGVNPLQCEAKVFGGGNMFPGNHHARGKQAQSATVGQRNGQAAQALLTSFGLKVASEFLYGIGHRQVIFDISTGDVWSRQILPTAFELDAELLAARTSRETY